MSDFVNQPLNELMNDGSVTKAVRELQQAPLKDSATVNSHAEVSGDLGIVTAGDFIAPQTQNAEPESTGFTGSFMSAFGKTFNGVIYNIGSVAAGVLQWGANTAGKLIAGAGEVSIDDDGISIVEGLSSGNQIKWLDYTDRTSVRSYIGGRDIAGASILDISSNGAISIIADSVSSGTFSVSIGTGVNNGIGINNNQIIFNSSLQSIDTVTKGDTDEYLIFADASADKVGIGTNAPTSKLHVNGNSDLDGAVTINDSSADVDTRIEGNTDANLLFVDAGNDRVGIGMNNPAYKLDVTGDINASGRVYGTDMQMIADSELGADAANFDFTSIPATYKHLRLVLSLRSDRAANADFVAVQINGDTGSNYDYLLTLDSNTATSRTQGLAQTEILAGYSTASTSIASDFDVLIIDFPNYASANANKDFTSVGTHRAAATSGNIYHSQANCHWRSTAAINRIKIYPSIGTNWKQYSRATLFGLR